MVRTTGPLRLMRSLLWSALVQIVLCFRCLQFRLMVLYHLLRQITACLPHNRNGLRKSAVHALYGVSLKHPKHALSLVRGQALQSRRRDRLVLGDLLRSGLQSTCVHRLRLRHGCHGLVHITLPFRRLEERHHRLHVGRTHAGLHKRVLQRWNINRKHRCRHGIGYICVPPLRELGHLRVHLRLNTPGICLFHMHQREVLPQVVECHIAFSRRLRLAESGSCEKEPEHKAGNDFPHCYPPQLMDSRPRNSAVWPSSSSIRRSWLYFAIRSVREAEPVLIWPAPVPTARSAMNVSSVSPERCEMIDVYPFRRASSMASSVSETLPIWFTFT